MNSSADGQSGPSISEKSVLEVGDLIRVKESSVPGKPRREASTGRVIRVKTIPFDELSPGDHPYLYDVKYIVGRKLSSVHRSELLFTTPYHEFSSIRKLPSTAVSDLMKENRENKSNRVSSEKNGPVMRLSDEKETSKCSVLQSSDLYDRHKKELEKVLLKLEKTDRKGLFYNDEKEEHSCLHELQENDEIPPTSWMDIRRRVSSDVYVLDRINILSKSKEILMAPYLSWRQYNPSTMQHDIVNAEFRFPRGVDWNKFRNDVVHMCAAATELHDEYSNHSDMLQNTINKIMDVVNDAYLRIAQRQESEMFMTENKLRFSEILENSNNKEPAIQSAWRKTPFPERLYQRLATSNVLCEGLLPEDQRIALFELETSLSDRFVGQCYTYDDNGQSESWMKSVISQKTARQKKRRSFDAEDKLAAYMQEDGRMIKAQVKTCMEKLLISVTDRVMTDERVLQKPEVCSVNWLDGDARKKLNNTFCKDQTTSPSSIEDEIHISNAGFDLSEASSSSTTPPPEVIEQPVWGIDCYTRKNIEACLEADFDSHIATDFIEKWLLPAINACPAEFAYDMTRAARILEGHSTFESPTESKVAVEMNESLVLNAFKQKLSSKAPVWLKPVACQLRIAVESIGGHAFCVHPKGHGSLVICSKGIPANTLVTHYRGEIYPPWRWGEKLDAIEEAQKKYKLKKSLPDFYNFCLERPQNDPRGYGILFVDASRKAGLGSSFSHSCNPTCEVKVVAIHGKMSLAITTIRNVEVGEELTFDYNGVTESLDEYHAAICLCGQLRCRGSFLHFATADCYQEILREDFPLAARLAALCKSCNKRKLSPEDKQRLLAHGFKTAAFGAVSFQSPQICDDIAVLKATESLNNVPVWLLTFAAETLKYIEYERRRLPIALVLKYISQKESSLGLGSVKDASKRKRLSILEDCSCLDSINLEDADAEGWSSMEQRIHQLVQTLSRVGRALSRQSVPHHPINIVPDDKVVEFLWCDEDGLWQSVKKHIDYIPIRDDFKSIDLKYCMLYEYNNMEPNEARSTLTSALLNIRQCILVHLNVIRTSMSSSAKNKRKNKRKDTRKEQKSNIQPTHLEPKLEEPPFIGNDMIDKLLATCDILLLYANTSTFFEIIPYASFSSSPIDVYARELGNVATQIPSHSNSIESEAVCASPKCQLESEIPPNVSTDRQSDNLLDSDQVVTSLAVEYKSDYVLSLLLQWFTGGINLHPGLPDMFGCIYLPSIRSLWATSACEDFNSLRLDREMYDCEIRPQLISSIEDVTKRGDPWPNDVKKFFCHYGRHDITKLVGSPTLDFYITGENSILSKIVSELRKSTATAVEDDETSEASSKIPTSNKAVESVSYTTDKEGAPTQAVSTNWVQCEKPDCMKWRKLPWHINVDDLPENFYCRNNIWNPKSSSCESPEDPWDDFDAPLPTSNNIPENSFVKGARFDVQRTGKRHFTEAVVVATDMSTRRVQFHFHHVSKELDEWLPISSCRIAPHKSYVR